MFVLVLDEYDQKDLHSTHMLAVFCYLQIKNVHTRLCDELNIVKYYQILTHVGLGDSLLNKV